MLSLMYCLLYCLIRNFLQIIKYSMININYYKIQIIVPIDF